MFGKHFASMYEGSMVGKGSAFFAVWGYVISHMRPDRELGANVELNPKIIGFLIGEDQSKVEDVIRQMCEPDPESRSQRMEGRKLVKKGEYLYGVVNGADYRKIRNEDERREYNRRKQAEYRTRKKGGSLREKLYEKNEGGIQTIPENEVLEKPVVVSEGAGGFQV